MVKISKSDAVKLGLSANKHRKNPHYADVAREKSKTNTQLKAWMAIKANRSPAVKANG